MTFTAAKSHVANRGVPPDDFLSAMLAWAQKADDSLFAVNDNPHDIYSLIAGTLGPWTGIIHRRAAMMEAMRVHAGLEAEWNWAEGKDPDNHNPDPRSWESGLFQVSFDSSDKSAYLKAYLASVGASTVPGFRGAMVVDRHLVFEYYARLVRISIAWAGPLVRKEILPWLSRDAVAEFQTAVIEPSE